MGIPRESGLNPPIYDNILNCVRGLDSITWWTHKWNGFMDIPGVKSILKIVKTWKTKYFNKYVFIKYINYLIYT